ncbi:amiloride-sensitive sodium channel subunit gamma [Plakobranchus ocellatus]|uniref:Amiloride-sensitive sodium channel subunit gamma n=1 Tax=Plakobranchus ocellatus TaxID=259542 RepID=A0AAV4CQN7_9GAST|nr:amiloride-sensitive sodium channel subunit gamma [Plakobranchus ocellatus]
MRVDKYPVMPAYEPSHAYRAEENRPTSAMSRKLKSTKKSIKREISAFFTETSFTALSRIYKAQSIFRRLAWATLVIAMMVWLGIQCFWLLDKYFRYPLEVKHELKASTELEFPSVTICNMNPIKKDKVSKPPFNALEKYLEPNIDDLLYLATLYNWVFEDTECKSKDFDCGNNRCIPPRFVCDGKSDCNNDMDEKDCKEYVCPEKEFKCSDHTCQPIHVRCDGNIDCPNGEDEATCMDEVLCPKNFVACPVGGRCIPTKWWCDGIPDCKGGTDELMSCNETSTSSTQATTPIDSTGGMTFNSTATEHFVPLTTADPSQPSGHATGRKKRDISGRYWPKHERKQLYYEPDKSVLRSHIRNSILKKWKSSESNMTEKEMVKALKESYANYIEEVRDRDGSQRKRENGFKQRQSRYRRETVREEEDKSEYDIDWKAILKRAGFSKWDALWLDSNASTSTFVPFRWDMLLSSFLTSFYAKRDEEWEAGVTYAYITAHLNDTVLERVGHKKRNFLASCEFNGYQCSPSNFTFTHSHKYGNCYTFNSMFDDGPPLTTRFQGPGYGLKMELFINQQVYVANLATEAGARVVIHKRGSMPFPEDNGISVMTGRSTSIGINQVKISRLPHPHGICANQGSITDYYAKYASTNYSKLSCLKSCYQNIVIDQCGCAVPFYFVPPGSVVCELMNSKVEKCVSQLYKGNADKYEQCDKLCPHPCQETQYSLTISSSVWPSLEYERFLTKKLAQTNSRYIGANINDDFTKLQIYYQDLIFTHIEQEKAYESMNLISDLGGQLGLWLGLSAITIGELCSLFFSVGRSLSSTWCGNSETSPEKEIASSRVLPTSLDDIYDDMYPEAAKYIPPDVDYFKKKLRSQETSNV